MIAESERARLNDLELDIAKRRAAIREKVSRLKDESAVVLQLEASLIELAQENESSERLLAMKEVQLEERLIALERREETLVSSNIRVDDSAKSVSTGHQSSSQDLDDRWKANEERARTAEENFQIEVARLRSQLQDMDDREGLVRERQRELTSREQSVAAWQRRLQSKEEMLAESSRSSLRRLEAELRERESILLME